jgi:hypothetical protein
VFADCRFERLAIQSCKGFGLVKHKGGFLSAQARSTFQRFGVENIENRVLPEQIEDAMTFVFKRFYRGINVKSCKEAGIRGSVRNEYAFGDKVIDYLVEEIVFDKTRERGMNMLKVTDQDDVFQFLNNSYKRRRIKTVYERLEKDLVGGLEPRGL